MRLTLFLVIVLFGCNFSEEHPKSKEPSVGKTKREIITKNQIMGIWTDGQTENATMDIREDSIFYVDALETYPYSLKKDTITIVYPDMDLIGRVHFKKDTLMIDSEEGRTMLWKFKN